MRRASRVQRVPTFIYSIAFAANCCLCRSPHFPSHSSSAEWNFLNSCFHQLPQLLRHHHNLLFHLSQQACRLDWDL